MIAILSDIHGNFEALTAVLDNLLKGPNLFYLNRIIVLGDLVDYGADSVKVINTLYSLRDKVLCIQGNHDEAVLRRDCSKFTTDHGRKSFEITRREIDQDTLEKLEEMCRDFSLYFIKKNNRTVSLYHGSLTDSWGKAPPVENVKAVFTNAAKIHIGGHSHISGVSRQEDKLYINPGSVGQPRNGDPRAQYVLAEDNFDKFYFKSVDYDISKASHKIIESGRPSFLATRLYLGI